MDLKILDRYGIDSKNGVSRCLNDESFYVMLLKMFLSDNAFDRAKAAYEADDRKALFDCVHDLKGSGGNVALTDFYNAVCPLVEHLRTGNGDKSTIDKLFPPMEEAYHRACEGISLVIASEMPEE